ncbi:MULTISPECIES: response regulator transcription factor [unclassified Paenibacillus]|uniref:response regulator transcription factor n=1 Tax=unclassified Paenibacillus TaxID=185978 RepID=UPI000839D107|nr:MULTISPECIES: response regulator [unclassified Paenibacillus]NWL87433.1 DNA-binding response regulator [Paenibacillus sp. 79R4]
MRLKALLVDDEVHILNNLSKVLPWEDLGFEIIGLAKNGVDALEAATLHHPDLILCDIRMPVMDGLTLIQRVREQGLTGEILLLTGYQEFEYARTAIRYGVRDYICKPINYFELEDTVRKLAKQIIEKKKQKNKEQLLSRVASLANENILIHSLLGQEAVKEDELWQDEEGAVHPDSYAVLLLDMDGYAHESISWPAPERKAWNLEIKLKLKELFLPLLRDYTVLQVREGEWCIIFDTVVNQPVAMEALSLVHENLQAIVKDKPHMLIRMCLGQAPHSLSEISAVYQRMQQILILNPSQGWFTDISNVSEDLFEPVPGGDLGVVDAQWHWVEQFGSGLRNGNYEAMTQMISDLKAYVARLNETSVGRAEKLLYYLLIHLLREMREMQMLPGEQEEAVWLRLQESLSVKELISLIVSLIERYKDSLSTKKSSEVLMMSAQNYIQQNLGSDFGIEDISDFLGISCSYFCLLFKNHFGETFVEYLTRQRIETAKYMLSGSEKSITQIGAEVGYQERRYFTKVFQKYTGMTPSEYRLKDSPAS